MVEIDLNIHKALQSDRSRLANLIHFGSHIHQHLDWKSPLDWIGAQPYLIMEKDSGLVAALACPPELPDLSWIRLFAVGPHIPVEKAWKILWDQTRAELTHTGNICVAALSLQGWFNTILDESDFMHTDNVIVLMCDSSNSIPMPKSKNLSIRPMIPEDLDVVVEIDNTAFEWEWRNSKESLELAYQQSNLATVAEMDEEIVGYQFSTSSAMGGHLARLAVSKSAQGQGIGYSLLHDVLAQFKHQGVRHVTVNTQQKNSVSIGLYAKAGFSSTGESYRVYQNSL